MSARQVILFDFTKGEVRKISQEEAAAVMAEQYARGVRMTCEGTPPPSDGLGRVGEQQP